MRIYLILFILFIFSPFSVSAATLKGYILLDVQNKGAAWYYNPVDSARYSLGRPTDAYNLLRGVGLGVKNSDLNKIPLAGSSQIGDLAFRKKMSGRILLQVESKGEAYYIYPKDLKRYYLGRSTDVLRVMSALGQGISSKDLGLIPLPAKNITGITSEKKTVKTSQGDFAVDILIIDLNQPNLELLSLTATNYDCADDCPAKSLKDYVSESKAVAAIHGAYFCPPDYADCQNKKNYYFYPFYNSLNQKLINEGEIKWLQGSILALDENNKYYLFPNGRDFKSVSDFEANNKVKLKVLISNNPALVQNGKNIVSSASLDSKQLTTKALRGGLGFKGKIMYWFVASKATVPDLALIATSLGLESALNLDGGGSSAMYYQNKYLVGPGRLLPTAIVVREK